MSPLEARLIALIQAQRDWMFSRTAQPTRFKVRRQKREIYSLAEAIVLTRSGPNTAEHLIDAIEGDLYTAEKQAGVYPSVTDLRPLTIPANVPDMTTMNYLKRIWKLLRTGVLDSPPAQGLPTGDAGWRV